MSILSLQNCLDASILVQKKTSVKPQSFKTKYELTCIFSLQLTHKIAMQ